MGKAYSELSKKPTSLIVLWCWPGSFADYKQVVLTSKLSVVVGNPFGLTFATRKKSV